MTKDDLQEYADIACLYLNIEPVKVHLKDTQCGRAHLRTRSLTIPAWALTRAKEFTIYYVCHEVSHFKYPNHGLQFKQTEQYLCNLAGIKIVYSRAYPKALYADGIEVYSKR